MPPSADCTDTLARLIAAEGPIGLDRFMAIANTHYYATRDPFGANGDFITAPEISQMFGELVGLALADLWQRVGRPPVAYVELGPGRGTLAADARRAMNKAGLDPAIHLVETSPLLRTRQAAALPQATWHETIDTLPTDLPLLIVANEFFDALPIRQLVRTVGGWRERMIDRQDEAFRAVPGSADRGGELSPGLSGADPGSVVEVAPAAAAIGRRLGVSLAAQGGALIAIDYGHDGGHPGDTLQAVRAHAYADPFAHPGASDLTAHVDFAALAQALGQAHAHVLGPVPQGQWLVTLGLAQRAAALSRATPEQEGELVAAYRRLTHPDEMGELFKVLGAVSPGWPALAGFG